MDYTEVILRSSIFCLAFPVLPSAFDSRCNKSDVDLALLDGCSVVGSFSSCGTGCSHDVQEARWANASGGLFGTCR